MIRTMICFCLMGIGALMVNVQVVSCNPGPCDAIWSTWFAGYWSAVTAFSILMLIVNYLPNFIDGTWESQGPW